MLAARQRGEIALRQPVDAPPGDVDLAGVGAIDAAEQVEQRRLARSGRPHHGDEIAARNRQIEMIEDA